MAKLYAKAPDGSDALLSIVITGFTQSLQQNGWCKLPNGLLIQWCHPVYNNIDKYFSISFLNVLSATTIGGLDTGSGIDDGAPRICYLTNEFINVHSGYNALVNSMTNFIIAIGE